MRSPRDAEDARAVLSGRSIAIPTFIAAMPGAVRGGDASAHPLRAIEPFRSAVLEARPRFSWTPVRDARSYRVAVFDADYEEIARSEALDRHVLDAVEAVAGRRRSVVARRRRDRCGRDLVGRFGPRRGGVPRAHAEGGGRGGAGEAHYRDSHLLRGLLYSRHGLLHDAEREFRALAEQNPGSPVARALIAVGLAMKLAAAALLLILPCVAPCASRRRNRPPSCMAAAKAHYDARRYKDALATYEKARAAAEAAGDSIIAARAKLGFASLKTMYGQFDEGIVLAREALGNLRGGRRPARRRRGPAASRESAHRRGEVRRGRRLLPRDAPPIPDGGRKALCLEHLGRCRRVARPVSPGPGHVARGDRRRDRRQRPHRPRQRARRHRRRVQKSGERGAGRSVRPEGDGDVPRARQHAQCVEDPEQPRHHLQPDGPPRPRAGGLPREPGAAGAAQVRARHQHLEDEHRRDAHQAPAATRRPRRSSASCCRSSNDSTIRTRAPTSAGCWPRSTSGAAISPARSNTPSRQPRSARTTSRTSISPRPSSVTSTESSDASTKRGRRSPVRSTRSSRCTGSPRAERCTSSTNGASRTPKWPS